MAASLTGSLRFFNQSRLSGVVLRVSGGVMPPPDALHCRIQNTRAAKGVTGDKVPQAESSAPLHAGWKSR